MSIEDYQNDLKFTIGTCTGADLSECAAEISEHDANPGRTKYICNGCDTGYVWVSFSRRLKDTMIAYHAVETA